MAYFMRYRKPMKLLCFAHRLEASCFFELKNFKAINSHTFLCEDTYLLITGEGLQSATESLCHFLAQNNKINQVYNIGIAAANPAEIPIRQVYSIRTLYKQKNSDSMEFTSFTTSDTTATTDIVSTENRIQDPKTAQNIFSFAPMIDREAWGLASVCKRFQIPFFAFKCSSDDATREACSQIRDLAFEFSEKLYEFYQSHIQSPTAHEQDQLCTPANYYFTFTQKQDFEKLIHKISLKENLTPQMIISSISQPDEKINKKDATKILLQNLKRRLDPFTYHTQETLDEIFKDLNTSKTKISYDRTMETDQLQLTAQISTLEDIEQLKKHLDKIPILKIHQILRGKHVE